jgi:hypothetical protein
MYSETELGFHKMYGISISSEKLKDEGSPWRKRENYQVSDFYGNKSAEHVRHN